MNVLVELPSIWIALIGWAATLLLIDTASCLSTLDRRLMCVSSWMLWMIPAFGALVSRGLIPMETAAAYVWSTTGGLALLLIIRALITPRTRP